MKYILLILFLFIFQYSHSQLNSCESIRKGEFTLVDEFAGNTYIKRRKKNQIEYGLKSKIKLKSKILWIDSCTYSVELIKIIRNPSDFPVPDKLQLIVKIIEVNDNYYKCLITDILTDRALERKIYFGKY